ncbi:hypothetical protein LTR64_003029 [Lithohypha guttulata]|uniref:uncharacterized protein n=1 Tax=Lithohypha guttulata TaxID=1690604 RepID=UPI002DDDF47F|nr:hypothetical protein LTR51_000748 [Lithohypha guttulata]
MTIYSNRQFTAPEDEPTKAQTVEKPQDKSSESPPWLNELYIISWLIFFSLLGTLARVGVEAITQYPDAPVTSRVLWANLGGSFLMGFLIEDRNLFGLPPDLGPSPAKDDAPPEDSKLSATHLKFKKAIPLYIGLTTGFCGSFTSFSTYLQDAFLALTNALPTFSRTTAYRNARASASRSGGFSFEALIAVLILHPAVSLAGLRAGTHLAEFLRPVLPQQIFHTRLTVKVLNPLFVLVGFGCWIFGALFLTIFPPASGPSPVNWRARATIPLLFAPPGCIIRFYLAKYFNRPSRQNFPLGTFLANIFGTLVLGMAWDLLHARSVGASIAGGNACAILIGIQQGFCGCLTTVSTWVVELNGMNWRAAWIYGLASVGVALAGLVVIMGSMGWTIGFAEPALSTSGYMHEIDG